MKPRYEILDGLRGVAALMVLCYHIGEGFATSPVDQACNHGYLAVDFFFILSGFVMGYAYDDRWKEMGVGGFFRRRLIRLHPMVVLAAVIGLVSFIIQGRVKWDGTPMGWGAVAGAFLLGALLLPLRPSSPFEVRGNGEMFPLNGPSWSLFFEYIGNIMYALLLRRMSTRVLRIWTIVMGAGLAAFAVLDCSGSYNIGVGWTMAGNNLWGGLLRMTFSYSAGLLMARSAASAPGVSPSSGRPVKGAFWICSAILVVLMAMPYAGRGPEPSWTNGLYDSLCVLVFFPLVLRLGASGTASGGGRFCSFIGKISYPLYIIHYPLMYLFYSHVWKHGLTFAESWPLALCTVTLAVILAFAALKLYDEPVRARLSRMHLRPGGASLMALLVMLLSLSSCGKKEERIVLETTMGTIELKLYDETPLHSENFRSLVKEGAFDSLLFHRVIQDFMIQGGDPDSKNAAPGVLLGEGDRPYTVAPEFRLDQGIFHRRGVLAAAREGDDVNPDRRSSAMQFYIVWGKIFDDEGLDRMQERLDARTGGQVKLTEEMRQVYKTVGGTPHLDGQYTVFGEVTGGLDVVDAIQKVETDDNDRPLTDVRIVRAYIR